MVIRSTLFFVLACMAAPVFGQDPTGILEGQVSDPSGGAISRADVIVRNAQTGFTATQHPSAGTFQFSYLPVGEYRLEIKSEGFAAFEVSGIHIDIGRTVHLPVRLTISASHTEVVVTGLGVTADLGYRGRRRGHHA